MRHFTVITFLFLGTSREWKNPSCGSLYMAFCALTYFSTSAFINSFSNYNSLKYPPMKILVGWVYYRKLAWRTGEHTKDCLSNSTCNVGVKQWDDSRTVAQAESS